MEYTHTFDRSGVFNYKITDYPWIEGVITVEFTQFPIGNSVVFPKVEKIEDRLFLHYEGHVDTDNGWIFIYTTDNQHLGDIGLFPDDEGNFSGVWDDPDDYYHIWEDGTYRAEVISKNENNKIVSSYETTFNLITTSGQENGIASKLPEWVRNIFIWYGEKKISEDELIGAIQFLVKQGIIKV